MGVTKYLGSLEARLMCRAIEKLVALARRHGVPPR
jgi:hypothetical protein